LGRFDTPQALLYDANEGEIATSMLSVPHLIIIFVVALVVFGPEKLPELARNFGKIMAEFRRHTSDLRSTFDEHMRELERETQAIEQRKRELDVREAALRTAQAAPAQPALPAAAPEIEAAVPAIAESAPVETESVAPENTIHRQTPSEAK
jgi:sec-independent protein translocase protein TatB